MSEDAAATVEDAEVAEASALPLDPLSPASSLPSDLAASVSPEMNEGTVKYAGHRLRDPVCLLPRAEEARSRNPGHDPLFGQICKK